MRYRRKKGIGRLILTFNGVTNKTRNKVKNSKTAKKASSFEMSAALPEPSAVKLSDHRNADLKTKKLCSKIDRIIHINNEINHFQSKFSLYVLYKYAKYLLMGCCLCEYCCCRPRDWTGNKFIHNTSLLQKLAA